MAGGLEQVEEAWVVLGALYMVRPNLRWSQMFDPGFFIGQPFHQEFHLVTLPVRLFGRQRRIECPIGVRF